MSLSLVQIPLKKVLAPVIDQNVQKNYVITKGAKENTYQTFPATNVNNNQVTITCNPPSQNVAINRRVYLRAVWNVQITGLAGAGGLMLQPGLDAPKAYPLSRSINTLQLTLNNDQFSTVLNQYWPAFVRYHNDLKLECDNWTMTPSYPDQYQEFNDFLNAFWGGSARNSLAGYGENVINGGGRGSAYLSNMTNIVDAANTATFNLEVVEPVFLSPLLFGKKEETGLMGIQNCSITCTFGDFAATIWSHNAAAPGASTINAITANLASLEAIFNYQSLPMDIQIPKQLVYDYHEVIPYSSPATPIASGLSTVITLNSVQLKTIPKSVYIFARESLQQLTFANGGANKTDCFAGIENINITFNNKVGLLSTLNQQMLYKLSVENGLDMPWVSFSKAVGSVIRLDFSKDLSLNETEASGIIGNWQFGLQATVRNNNTTRNIQYQLYAVVVNEGVVNVVNGSVSHQVGVFNATDILNTPVDRTLKYNRCSDVYGGMEPIKQISEVAKQALKPVAQEFEEMGLGGALVEGGKMMSRKMLRKRM